MKTTIVTAALLLPFTGAGVQADEGWDLREARVVREQVYLAISPLTDFEQVKQTFERMLANDATVAPSLMGLLTHPNQDVAGTAAQGLGRFPSAAVSAALRQSYSADQRVMVRINALAGLARMRDPATGTLARAALLDQDSLLQGGGLGALEKFGDSSNSVAILEYMDRQGREFAPTLFEVLGKLGDAPGSTAVRDRLFSEANNKANHFSARLLAAQGLEKMGQVALVRHILDLGHADATCQSLPVVSGRMRRLARSRGANIKSQADVDALLRDVDLPPNRRVDDWGRAFRARFVSEGVFHVVSDGPDMTPNTPDDLSSGEAFDSYQQRVFADLF